MKKHNNVFLVGPMGVGKTTIGKALADCLGLGFYDSDREIEASTGADIPWIFDVEGEAGFRIREVRMIDELSQRKNIVLATGGGAVLAEENRQRLHERGHVVYLRASINQQLERTSRDKNRPLLQTANPEKKIRELMKIRDPLYREVAHMIVDTNRRNARSVSLDICRRLEELQAGPDAASKKAGDESGETRPAAAKKPAGKKRVLNAGKPGTTTSQAKTSEHKNAADVDSKAKPKTNAKTNTRNNTRNNTKGTGT